MPQFPQVQRPVPLDENRVQPSSTLLKPARPWWETASARDKTEADAFCRKLGTGQCAALCLQYLSHFTPGAGGCPERERVWCKGYQCWSLEEADKLELEEVQLGYRDARRGEPKPKWPGNRSDGYVHGWYAGARDAGRLTHEEAPWLRELARQYIARERAKKGEHRP